VERLHLGVSSLCEFFDLVSAIETAALIARCLFDWTDEWIALINLSSEASTAVID
jgi:hypothetical protein